VKFIPISTSIVIAGKAHRPALLSPQELRAKGIVPADWQLAGPWSPNSQLSIVRYNNGISFMAESVKLIARDEVAKKESLLPDLMSKYVAAVSDIYCFAVGINCDGYVECPAPEEWIVDRFLKRGPGNDDKLRPSAIGLKLSYPVENGVLNISCDAGTVQRASENREIQSLLINANYHLNVSEVSVDEAQRAIKSYDDRIAHFHELADNILGLKSEK